MLLVIYVYFNMGFYDFKMKVNEGFILVELIMVIVLIGVLVVVVGFCFFLVDIFEDWFFYDDVVYVVCYV